MDIIKLVEAITIIAALIFILDYALDKDYDLPHKTLDYTQTAAYKLYRKIRGK